jgi:hypothetical protein
MRDFIRNGFPVPSVVLYDPVTAGGRRSIDNPQGEGEPMKKLLVASLALALILAANIPCQAVTVLDTEGPGTTAPGSLDASFSFDYAHYTEGSETALYLSATTGLIPNLDVTASLPYLIVSPDEGDGENGLGVYLKWNFLAGDEKAYIPSLAVKGGVKIPTADEDKGLGSGEVDWFVGLVAGSTFGPLSVYANLAYTIVGEPSGVSLDNIFSYGLALEYALNESFTLVAEANGATAPADGADSSLSFLGGAVYSITEALSVDAGVRFGVGDDDPDWVIEGGVAYSY